MRGLGKQARHAMSWLGALSALTVSSTHAGPSFQGLGDLPGGYFDSRAWAVSADGGTVVGRAWSLDPDWGNGPLGFEAMRWTARDGLMGLGGLPGLHDSTAFGVSADGNVVVGWSNVVNGIAHPFRWTAQHGMQALPGLPGGDGSGIARGVSANGSVIVGASKGEAVRWTNGGVPVPLGSITGSADLSSASGVSANGSVIVGDLYNGSLAQAFRWTQEDGVSLLGSLPGDAESRHPIVSGDGSTIVGQSSRNNAITQDAFLWREGLGMVLLAPRPTGIGEIEPFGISADGSVVVGILIEEDPLFLVHPFIWDAPSGLRDLEDVLVGDLGLAEAADWHLGYATGISADGQVIVGSGVNPSGDREAWMATIPEPSTLCFLSVGVLSVLIRRPRSAHLRSRRRHGIDFRSQGVSASDARRGQAAEHHSGRVPG